MLYSFYFFFMIIIQEVVYTHGIVLYALVIITKTLGLRRFFFCGCLLCYLLLSCCFSLDWLIHSNEDVFNWIIIECNQSYLNFNCTSSHSSSITYICILFIKVGIFYLDSISYQYLLYQYFSGSHFRQEASHSIIFVDGLPFIIRIYLIVILSFDICLFTSKIYKIATFITIYQNYIN